MASSAINPGVLVTLQDLQPSSPFFKDGASLQVTGKLTDYSVETGNAMVYGSFNLKIDTQHLRDPNIRIGSICQFIGELLIAPDNEAILQAQVGRNVDGGPHSLSAISAAPTNSFKLTIQANIQLSTIIYSDRSGVVLTGYNAEFASPVAPARLFKGLVIDLHHLVPQVVPKEVKSAAIVSGDGGVGSIKQYTFTEAVPYDFAKNRIDVLDKDSLVCKYTMIEGDDIGKKLKSATYQIKVEASGNGGSVCKLTAELDTIDGVKYTQEQLNMDKDGMLGTYKAIEAYLLANPTVCAA